MCYFAEDLFACFFFFFYYFVFIFPSFCCTWCTEQNSHYQNVSLFKSYFRVLIFLFGFVSVHDHIHGTLITPIR